MIYIIQWFYIRFDKIAFYYICVLQPSKFFEIKSGQHPKKSL